jgi:predicted phosphohydrolase
MALFAISDLHLGFAVDKPMDRFGPQWIDHAARVARAWRERVGVDDTVLVCGDTSWAMRLEEARPDLDFLGELPGRKILLRGNHDYWWGSLAKVRRALPAGIEPLQNGSLEAAGWVICGSRGWLLPTPASSPEDVAIYHRELGRLRLSLESARPGLPRLAMLHYPPWMPGLGTTEVVDLLQAFEVQVCVYGHLHALEPGTYPEGLHDGIRYHCVSVDLVDFAPRRLDLDVPGDPAALSPSAPPTTL